MNLPLRRSFALIALLVIAASGCEDEAARNRVEVQTQIAQASRDLELASLVPVVPGDESFDQRRRSLDQVKRSLATLTGAEKGQQAAAALVTAAAERELAAMDLAEIDDAVSENRRLREMVQSHIDAAMRLDAIARGRERLSTADERASLSQERTQAERRLRDYSETMASLDGPIAERVNQNQRDAAEAARLDQEASSLRRQAAEWGHFNGLQHFLDAIQLERQADRFEYDMAQRDNDLRYDLEPEHELAQRQVESLRSLLKEINESESSLETHDRLSASEVETTRRLVASFRDRISDALQTLAAQTSETVEPKVESAKDSLENMARQATRAAGLMSGDEADSGRLEAARAHEQLASLHAESARRLNDHASILARLADAEGVLGDPARYRAELTRIQAALEASRTAAKEALTEAQAELERVRGKGSRSEVDAFKTSLADLLAKLSAAPGTVAAAAPRTGRSGGSANAAPAGGCASSPEEIASFLNDFDMSNLDSAGAYLDMIRANTPAARSLVEAQRKALGPVRELFSAVEDTFSGPGVEQFLAGAAQGMGSVNLADVEVVDADDSSATLRASAATGEEMIELVKVGECWMVDGESLTQGMDAATIRQQTAMIEPMLEAMSVLATRIRDGEFATVEEAMQSYMTTMMGGMGGMGGMGEPPSK